MLECVPQSIFSWTFDILGAPEGPGTVAFNVFTEQGTLTLGTDPFAVEKPSLLSGTWRLLHDGRPIAEASKTSAFRRRFAISGVGGNWVAQATSLGRSFELLDGDTAVGVIKPNSAFGYRSYVDCDPRVPALDQIFAFWLVVMAWRRAAKSD